jgi:hypothetical protein
MPLPLTLYAMVVPVEPHLLVGIQLLSPALEALEAKPIGLLTLVTPAARVSRPVQQVARALEQVAPHQPVVVVDWVVLWVEVQLKLVAQDSRIRSRVHLFLMAVLAAAVVGMPLAVQVEQAAALLVERI